MAEPQAGRLVPVQIDMADDPTGTPNWQTIAKQTDGAESGSTNTADGSHKDDTGWQRGVPVQTAWEISVGTRLDPDDPVLTRIRQRWKAKATVYVRANKQALGGDQDYGEALISSFEITFPNLEVANVSITFEGQGVLNDA